MKEYFKTLNRLIKTEGEIRTFIEIRSSRLLKALPNSTDNAAKSRGELADELSMKRERVGEGLKLLKQNSLAKYDAVKRGWRKANK
jgi:hypothetical protein